MNGNSKYNALMQEVCANHGWCGGIVNGKPSHVDDFIPKTGSVNADQFVDWLFQADGMDPQHDLGKWQKHKDALRKAFVKHMGAESVDATMLQWRID